MSTTEAGRLTGPSEPDGARASLSLQTIAGQTRRLDELSCARVLGQAADAVHAAQAAQKGLPLGTITPAAIVIAADGKVSVVPAGAATAYTAPEKLRGGPGDRRADVFALGVVLWEALVHARLFDGADDDAVKQAVLDRPIAAPSERNANVPAELDAIVVKALARDPADRHASAKVLAAEIDAMLGDAGYPESNDQIAAYVARSQKADAVGKSPERRSQTLPPASKTAPLPLPSVRPSSGTLPTLVEPSRAAETLPPPAEPPRTSTLPPPFSSARPGSQTILGAPGSPGALASALAAAQPTAPKAPTPAQPLPTVAAARTTPTPAQPLPTVVEPSRAGRTITSPPKSAKTEILGSLSDTVPGSPAPAVAVADTIPGTSFTLGLETPTQIGAPPVSGTAAGSAPVSFGPPEMPPPVGSAPVSLAPPEMPLSAAAPQASAAPAAAIAAPASASLNAAMQLTAISFPPPVDKPSLANADTLPTPQLPAHLAIPASPPAPATPVLPGQYPVLHPAQLAAHQLSMPPGITVAPSSPPAAIHSADAPPSEANPVEVVALRPPQGPGTSRDVLAGWGWTTGATAIVEDHDSYEDDARASRKRLLIAIGGALGVALIIAIIALAAGGSKPADDQAASAKPAPAAPTVAAIAPPAPSPAPAPEPAKPVDVAAADPSAVSANPAGSAAASSTSADSPATTTSTSPVAAAAPSPAAAAPSPPPAPAPTSSAVAVPSKPAAPPAAKPAPPPAKPAIAQPAPARPEVPAKPKAPPKRAPEKLTKPARPAVQPVDPYAADRPHTDPSTSYRTGLQQLARGDTTGALVTFRSSVTTNPSFAPAWRGLGLAYEKLGNRAQARLAYRKYLQLAPDAVDVEQIRDRMERLGS